MKAVQVTATLVFLSIITAFSCDDKTTVVAEKCGCNGTVKNTVANKQGTAEVIEVSGKRIFRIFNKNENLYFIVCDTTAIASTQRTSHIGVRFSGDVRGFCDEPTVHLLPPIYQPISITELEVVE